MSKASSHLPAGFHTVTVHLTVNGAAAYIDFLKKAFDAVELTRSTSPDGRLLNASVRLGDSVMMLNDLFPEFGGEAYRSGKALRLTLYLPDADAARAKALAAGCKIAMPIEDQFWGDRYGEVEDPFGFVWAIATHLEDLNRCRN
jgi:PhnB protein